MRPVPTRHAFSITELLVVIIIIGVLISLIVPTLGSVRDQSKISSTDNLLARLNQSIAQFQTDKRRLPGYFTPSQMGNQANLTRGMSAMENVMLDLLPPRILTGSNSAGATTPIQVGPTRADAIAIDTWTNQTNFNYVNTQASYFVPPNRYYAVQTNSPGDVKQFGERGHTGAPAEDQLPDLLDAFGTPLLLWAQDDSAPGEIDPTGVAGPRFTNGFVNPAAPNSRAKFYWASNAAFLKATSVGKKNIDMTTRSYLGGAAPDPDNLRALEAFLGSPAAPAPADWTTQNANAIFPKAARGSYLVQSAGPDGIFLSREASKGNRGPALQTGNTITFGRCFKDASNQVVTPSIDLKSEFDDLITSGS